MNNSFFEALESALAGERLDAFRQDGVSRLITMSRYVWNMALCESLYSPLQLAEIALRNSIHACLADQFSAEDWYITSGLMLPWQEHMVERTQLESELAATSNPLAALEVQRRIEAAAREFELQVLRIQVEFARREGRIEVAERLEVELLLDAFSDVALRLVEGIGVAAEAAAG